MAENITALKTAGEAKLAENFNASKSRLPGSPENRQGAFDNFASKGLPHKRVEEFKYTDVRAFLDEVAPLSIRPGDAEAKAALEAARLFAAVDAFRITFVDGHFIHNLSDIAVLPKGIEIVSLAEAMAGNNQLLKQLGTLAKASDNPLYQLNSAFMGDGAIIRITKGTKLDKPLHLRFLSGTKPVATASRVLVLAEEDTNVTLLESHESRDGLAVQPNDVIEFKVANGSVVEHVRINAEGRDALAFSTLTARLGANVSFATTNAVFGAKVSRHQVYLAFEGDHSTAKVNGTALLNGIQHADSTLVADHIAPNCDSRELFKTVIDDDAVGVFQGRINVNAEAQKTDGKMMSACLLLSETGAMYNKPELEIFADDVQCGHGATCGALDEDLLFYLKARGLPHAEAESLLIQAFIGEAIEMVGHEEAREELISLTSHWLKKRG